MALFSSLLFIITEYNKVVCDWKLFDLVLPVESIRLWYRIYYSIKYSRNGQLWKLCTRKGFLRSLGLQSGGAFSSEPQEVLISIKLNHLNIPSTNFITTCIIFKRPRYGLQFNFNSGTSSVQCDNFKAYFFLNLAIKSRSCYCRLFINLLYFSHHPYLFTKI